MSTRKKNKKKKTDLIKAEKIAQELNIEQPTKKRVKILGKDYDRGGLFGIFPDLTKDERSQVMALYTKGLLNEHNLHDCNLSEKITGERIIEAFTKPGKQFQFPISKIPIGTDKETKTAIYLTGGIVAIGIIIGFIYLAKKK
jgi:hypothetical protein